VSKIGGGARVAFRTNVGTNLAKTVDSGERGSGKLIKGGRIAKGKERREIINGGLTNSRAGGELFTSTTAQ